MSKEEDLAATKADALKVDPLQTCEVVSNSAEGSAALAADRTTTPAAANTPQLPATPVAELPAAAAAEFEAPPSDSAAAGVDGEVHFHLPDSIKDMSTEQLAALTAGAASAVATAAPPAASTDAASSAAVTDGIATDTEGLVGSETPSWNSGGTAGALPAERARASFDVEKMINILDGGEEETKKRRWIIGAGDIVASSELFGAAKYDLPRDGPDGAIASAFEHFMRVHGPWLEQMYVPTGNETMYMSMGNMMGGCTSRVLSCVQWRVIAHQSGVQRSLTRCFALMPDPGFGLFMLTMLGQTSDEQKSWWMEAAYSMSITGAYAQTELGHGSNVRGLQTTATYDKATEEWVLSTPTLAAMKWWPSNLVMATHCVLYAQMIIDGVEHGVHVFMLQLRDEELQPLPGIEVGDIGATDLLLQLPLVSAIVHCAQFSSSARLYRYQSWRQ